jgi:hypothetical protein
MTDNLTPIVETHWRIGSTDLELVICGLHDDMVDKGLYPTIWMCTCPCFLGYS